MDDEKKLKITRNQLLEEGRKTSRIHMVSDRIYRNHLKTRFFNLQEQKKLSHKITELEKLEKDSWRDLDHKKLHLERRAARINKTQAIQRLAKSPSITPRGQRGKRDGIEKNVDRFPKTGRMRPRCGGERNVDRFPKTGRMRPRCGGERKPSYNSLLSPYIENDQSSRQFSNRLGYAQHFTNKQLRKSSTINTNIDIDDIHSYHRPYMSDSQAQIFRGLKKSTKGLIRMGLIKLPQRRISSLPEPPSFTEDQARYIRLPAREHDADQQKKKPLGVTYEDQLIEDGAIAQQDTGQRRRSLPHISHLLAPTLRRRGSRSQGEVDMKKQLPFIGRSPSPVLGLDKDFMEKLTLFNGQLYNLRRRDSMDTLPENHFNSIAPPPRDIFGDEAEAAGNPISQTEDEPKREPMAEESSEEPFETERLKQRPPTATVDLFNLSKWRKNMALTDTLPSISSCKYIRNPNKERYDSLTNQWYDIAPDEEGSSDETGSEITTLQRELKFMKVVRAALLNKDTILEDQELE